ncbi:hypothetical protein GCM10023333_19160 [Ferrimonas pelagia]|uniref:Uncharacterized protein n=1 Tax=Ferrimonas pelagia TaxID=1177826 RepID=A0ABP9ERX4_9GAMM
MRVGIGRRFMPRRDGVLASGSEDLASGSGLGHSWSNALLCALTYSYGFARCKISNGAIEKLIDPSACLVKVAPYNGCIG